MIHSKLFILELYPDDMMMIWADEQMSPESGKDRQNPPKNRFKFKVVLTTLKLTKLQDSTLSILFFLNT